MSDVGWALLLILYSGKGPAGATVVGHYRDKGECEIVSKDMSSNLHEAQKDMAAGTITMCFQTRAP